jgi:hypothetical protein
MPVRSWVPRFGSSWHVSIGLPVETIEARLEEEEDEDEIHKQLNTLRERVDEWKRTAAE